MKSGFAVAVVRAFCSRKTLFRVHLFFAPLPGIPPPRVMSFAEGIKAIPVVRACAMSSLPSFSIRVSSSIPPPAFHPFPSPRVALLARASCFFFLDKATPDDNTRYPDRSPPKNNM